MAQAPDAPSAPPSPSALVVAARAPPAPGPSAPRGRSGLQASRAYLLAAIAVVVFIVVVLEWAYSLYPVPPGPDTGKWVATSYAYIGHAYPYGSAFSNPYSYPPLTFAFLGPTYVATGSPYTAAFVYAGLLLFVFGLSLVHLSRRYLLTGPLQLGFVAFSVLSGTIFSMLFWGGLPNFLGFILLNEALVFLVAFLRSKSFLDGVVFWGLLSLIYLAHDLTFAIALATVGIAALVLLVHRRIDWRFLVNRANLVGIGLLILTVAGYAGVTRLLQIPHPGYLFSNPAAYNLNPIGLVFNPVTVGCSCPGDNLPNFWALFILFLVPLVLLVGLYAIRNSRVFAYFRLAPAPRGPGAGRWVKPKFVDNRLLIAASYVSATCLAPAIGWLVHVDTDYTRFGYFFPVPILLVIFLLVERAMLPWLVGDVRSPVEPAYGGASAPPPGAMGGNRGAAPPLFDDGPPYPELRAGPGGSRIARAMTLSAIVIVTLILAVQIVPLAQRNEQFFGGSVADPSFEATLSYLSTVSTPGSVLADSGHTAHWVEAATARDTYFPGPTWIHFYPYQILRDEESYWALNSEVALTDNQVTLSYSGTNDSTLFEAPMYSAYVQGVIFPVLRIDPTTLTVNTTRVVNGSVVAQSVAYDSSWVNPNFNSPSLRFVNATPPMGWLNYTTPNFVVSISSTVGPGGSATIGVGATVAPNRTAQQIANISGLSFRFLQPPPGPKLVRFGNLNSAGVTSTGMFWNVTNRLGSLPGTYLLPTTGAFSAPATGATFPAGAHKPSGIALSFADAAPGPSFAVSIALSTAGTSNPAVHLPAVLDSAAFLQNQGIQLLVLPKYSGTGLITTTNYMRQEFGLKVLGPGNPEWIILSR